MTRLFYSEKFKKNVLADVIEKRKYTVKLKLDDGKVIIKKNKQLIPEVEHGN
jgi:hypothetical protein